MEETLRQVPISQIETDPDQPRKALGDLAGLKVSIQREAANWWEESHRTVASE